MSPVAVAAVHRELAGGRRTSLAADEIELTVPVHVDEDGRLEDPVPRGGDLRERPVAVVEVGTPPRVAPHPGHEIEPAVVIDVAGDRGAANRRQSDQSGRRVREGAVADAGQELVSRLGQAAGDEQEVEFPIAREVPQEAPWIRVRGRDRGSRVERSVAVREQHGERSAVRDDGIGDAVAVEVADGDGRGGAGQRQGRHGVERPVAVPEQDTYLGGV
jgi:hypothetical protein